VTKYPVKKVELKQAGISTLGARKIWLDESVMRLNEDGHGRFLGDFRADEKLLVVLDSGLYKLLTPELSTHFDENLVLVEKWIPEKAITCVYFDGEKQQYFVKRFLVEDSKGPVNFISEHPKSKMITGTTLHHPSVYIRFDKRNKAAKNKMDESVNLREFIAVKGLKALGNRLTAFPVLSIELLEADEQREQESENLLQQMLEAKRPQKIEIERNDEEQTDLDESKSKKGMAGGKGEQASLF
jgi:topoisomerase-4 subunit A